MKVSFSYLLVLPVLLVLTYLAGIFFPDLAEHLKGLEGFASLLIVVLTAVYVFFTGLMVQQMIKAQADERRPYIIADFNIQHPHVWFVVKNIGRLPALNLTIIIDPELIALRKSNLSQKVFSTPFKFFPPGKEFRTFINAAYDFLDESQPDNYTISISYNWLGHKEFVAEEIHINLDAYKHAITVNQNTIHDLTNELIALKKEISSIEGSIKKIANR